MLRAITGAATSLAILFVAASSALAQDTDESRARLHFQTGASYYEAGEYADALREFERAYELSHRADLFYNLSLCHERLGDVEQAASFLERYLAEATDVQNRPNLEIRLRHFRERIAADALRAEQAAAERASAPPEGSAPAPASTGGPNVGAIASFSVAAVGVLGAAIFAPLAFVEDDALASGCGATSACSESDLGTLRAYTITTDVSLSVALAAASVGLVLLLVGGDDDPGASDHAALYAAPFAAPGTVGVAVGGAL